jgi:GT2 family glycosyltransferase
VDDGSRPPLRVPDSTPRMEIRLIRLPQNQGIVRALNAGMKAALAAGFEFIARIDAGDFSSPDRLEKQVAYLDTHPQCMLVGSDVQICDEDGTYYFTIQPQRNPRALRAALHERAWLVHSSVMYRASVLRQVGLYTDVYKAAEDYEMYLRIASDHEVGIVPETLVTSVIRKAGISMKNTRTQAISRLRIQLRYFQWTQWRSYLGAFSTIATLVMPGWLKLAFKTTFLYSRVPPGQLNQQQNIEIRSAGE